MEIKKYLIAIIGTGFSGQSMAINLLKKGITDFCILERRDFVGGTWCQNKYPGAAVDVHSPLYSISHELYPWTEMLAKRDELERYTHKVIDKYKLREKTILNYTVSRAQWNEKEMLWEIFSENQPTIKATYIINATGAFSNATIPQFKGIDTFTGKSFHSNTWDENYDYKGKKVAIIGSGASAAQIIPAIASDVAELYVFQRSAHWVMPRPEHKFSLIEQKMLKNKFLHKILREIIYWSLESRIIGFIYNQGLLKLVAQRKATNHLKKYIKDPALLKKLLPNYTIGCKRIILSNNLYPTFNRENVELFTGNDQLKEINNKGILTQSNKQVNLDLIVYATGYDAIDGLISYEIIGKDKTKLKDYWEDYPRAYLGTTMPKFPNLFIITGPNTGIGHTSLIHIAESQIFYIMNCLKHAMKKNNYIEVKNEAEETYTKKIHEKMEKTVWQNGGCNSWYKSEKSNKVIGLFPDFSFVFRIIAKRFKAEHHIIQ
jgi:cation diffusion facilitator CzcD-associated flavoprotein CzcO